MDDELPNYVQSVLNQLNLEEITEEERVKRRRNKHKSNNNNNSSSSEEYLPEDNFEFDDNDFYDQIGIKYLNTEEKQTEIKSEKMANNNINWGNQFQNHGEVKAFIDTIEVIIEDPNKFRKNKKRFQIIQQIKTLIRIMKLGIAYGTAQYNAGSVQMGTADAFRMELKDLVYALRFSYSALYEKKDLEFSQQLGFGEAEHQHAMKFMETKKPTYRKNFNNYNNNKYKRNNYSGGNNYNNNYNKKYNNNNNNY